MMVKAALMCCLAYWLANVIQKLTLLNTSFSPICLCALTGLLLGKPQEGLVMGGYLQAVYLGTISIGGIAPFNKQLGSIIPCAFVLVGGLTVKEGLAIATTIGALTNQLGRVTTPIIVALEPYWNKLIAKTDTKGYNLFFWFFFLTINYLPSMLVIFFSVAFGTEGVATLMHKLPTLLLNGLSVASGCMTAVGIGIALTLTWKAKFAGFFFIGWVMKYVLNMSAIQCGIVAISVGIIWFFISSEIENKLAASSNAPTVQRGGDFF